MVFVAGHFGEWIQGRFGPEGPVVLVTMACPDLGVSVDHHDAGPLSVAGVPPVLTPDQAARFFELLGSDLLGQVRVTPDFPPGGGAGMSTAALVALGRLAGQEGPAIARACLAVEGASDPLMWPAPDRVLWASRRGEVLAETGPVPNCEVLGGFWGPPERTNPADEGFPDVRDLIEAWPAADLRGKAQLASESARRCTALRGPAGDPTERLAVELGALGFARAHTGPARALIYAPGTVPDGAETRLRRAGFGNVLRFRTGGEA
ncbi:propanediol utilization protein [Mameliella alba]|nr:propanediol utilization protein [Mameliella alba]MBY6171827.1 propanediol utilization protein [Mameliella alba]MBY6177052.1 propanediol utilization protein [Mameliella alba]